MSYVITMSYAYSFVERIPDMWELLRLEFEQVAREFIDSHKTSRKAGRNHESGQQQRPRDPVLNIWNRWDRRYG